MHYNLNVTLYGKFFTLLTDKPSITQNDKAVYFDISVLSVMRTMKKFLEGSRRYGDWEIK